MEMTKIYLPNQWQHLNLDNFSVQDLARFTIMKMRAEALESSIKANLIYGQWMVGQNDVNRAALRPLLQKTMQTAEVVMRSPALESEADDKQFADAIECHSEALRFFYSKLEEYRQPN